MNRVSFASALSVYLPSAVVAQATHLVGPGGHPQINDAIAAAAPGDVILVQPGSYAWFLCNKGVTIRGTVAGAATAAGFFANVINVPAGQTAHVVDMHLVGAWVVGRASIDNCLVDGPNGYVSINSAVVTMQSTVVRPAAPPLVGGQSALFVANSDVTVVDSVIEAYDGTVVQAGVAIELFASRLRGSGLVVSGGAGLPVIPALRADAASHVWLSDSVVTANPAACAIVASNGRHDRCVLSPSCSQLPAGFVLGLARPSPIRIGAPFVLELRGTAGLPIAVWFAENLERTTVAAFEQSVLLPVATASTAGVLLADANGLAVGSWPVPLVPALLDRTVWCQAFTGLAWPLQASAVAGGVIR